MEGGGTGRRGVPREWCGAYIGAGAGPRCAGQVTDEVCRGRTRVESVLDTSSGMVPTSGSHPSVGAREEGERPDWAGPRMKKGGWAGWWASGKKRKRKGRRSLGPKEKGRKGKAF